MHLIELGLGKYSLIADHAPGTLSMRIRPGVHGRPVGASDIELASGIKPEDTVITFSSKKNIEGVIAFLQQMADRIDEETEDDSDDEGCYPVNGCRGQSPCLDEPGDSDCGYRDCQGESTSDSFEIPAHATGSDKDGDYRLIKLDSMPENWSHIRMYQNGGAVVVNKDFTERPLTNAEAIGVLIFVSADKWSYVDQPAKSEYPKYVLNNRGDWDIAYIEQAGPSEWSCVNKDRTRSEMFPCDSRSMRITLFNQFIGDGSWRYVTKAEAVSRLESQS